MKQPFICDMNALTHDQRIRHRELALMLRPAVTELEELVNGYEATLDLSRVQVADVEHFAELERLCCPFLNLAVMPTNEGDAVSLRITGQGDVKPFIRIEFGISKTGEGSV